jgi:hypothetical protein
MLGFAIASPSLQASGTRRDERVLHRGRGEGASVCVARLLAATQYLLLVRSLSEVLEFVFHVLDSIRSVLIMKYNVTSREVVSGLDVQKFGNAF